MKSFTVYLIVFLLLNFGALAIGGLSTSSGVVGHWYLNLNKAPWTPPGWFFGFAWTTIMILFSVQLSLYAKSEQITGYFIALYLIQLMFNIAWNPVFFKYQMVWTGVAVLILLFISLLLLNIHIAKNQLRLVWFSAPYLVWLVIATSLNLYIAIKN